MLATQRFGSDVLAVMLANTADWFGCVSRDASDTAGWFRCGHAAGVPCELNIVC